MKRTIDFILGVPLVRFFSLFSSIKGGPRREPRKILIIKLAAVGDTILLVPVVRSLRAALPSTQIHWLVSSINYPIAQTIPGVDRLFVWPGFSIGKLYSLISKLRAEKYDAVIDLEQWARGTALIALATGAPLRAGFDTPRQARAGVFTHTFKKNFDAHELKDFFSVVKLLVDLDEDDRQELWETDRGQRELERFAHLFKKKTGPRILIHPGCGKDGTPREWPLGKFAVVVHWLIRQYKAEIFLSAGPDEREKSAKLNKLINNAGHDMGGALSWEGMISLISRMDAVISGNTGIMHVAAALHKPQIALHGPTNPVLWGPINARAINIQTSCAQCPCLKLGFEYHRMDQSCMDKIEVDEVKRAAQALFDKPHGIC